jgi:hypothetical protein
MEHDVSAAYNYSLFNRNQANTDVSWVILIYGTIPVVTLVATIVSMALFRRKVVAGIYGHVSSLFLLALWCTAAALWFQCDVIQQISCGSILILLKMTRLILSDSLLSNESDL